MASWFSEYRLSLKAIEIEEFFDLVFYRPLAFVVVKLIYRTNITPNQLTYTALFFGIVAGICFSFGTKFSFLLGGLSYILFNVFDCSDGQLARLKKNGTPIGRIIDGVADYLAGIAVYSGITIGYILNKQDFILWICLLFAAAASHVVHSMITDFYRQRFIRSAFGINPPEGDPDEAYKNELARLKKEGGSRISINILKIYLAYSSRQNKLTGDKDKNQLVDQVKPADFYKKNVTLMRFWTFLGPTTQITFLVITSLLFRPDLYILGMLIGFNLLALVLYIFQRITDYQLSIRKA